MDDEASAKLLKMMLQQQGSRTEVLSGNKPLAIWLRLRMLIR